MRTIGNRFQIILFINDIVIESYQEHGSSTPMQQWPTQSQNPKQ